MIEPQLKLIIELIDDMIYKDRLEHDVNANMGDKYSTEDRIEYIKKELLEGGNYWSQCNPCFDGDHKGCVDKTCECKYKVKKHNASRSNKQK